MKLKSLITGGVEAEPVPNPGAVPNQVDLAGEDTIFPEQGDAVHTATSSKDLVNKSAATFAAEVFNPVLTSDFITSLRLLIQFVLLHLSTPPTLKMLAHTANADTKLVPAIDALLKAAAAIKEQEPRALKDVDLVLVAARRTLLLQYRDVMQALQLGLHCVEAGTTHLEQYLDGLARSAYPHLADLVSTDYNMGQLLEPVTALVLDPALQALQTKKANEKLVTQTTHKVHAAGQPIGVTVAPAPSPAGTPGQNPTTVPSTPVVQPTVAGTPAPTPKHARTGTSPRSKNRK